jgi:hypothetical protein
LVAEALAACGRLEKLLGRIGSAAPEVALAELSTVRAKVAALSLWSPEESDGQIARPDRA